MGILRKEKLKGAIITICIGLFILFLFGCATTAVKTIGTQMGMNRPVMKAAPMIQTCNLGHTHVSLFKSDYDAIMRYIKWLEEK